MVDGRDLVADASVGLRSSNAGASAANVVVDSHERVEAAGSAPNPEEIDDDAFAIYSYYISVTDHLPSDIRRSLNLMTSLAQKYTGPANDYESLADVLNNDQYSAIIPILSRLKDVDANTILRDRRESVREAVRMLQVIRRHYKRLDAEITKMEKAAQVPITSKILQAKAPKVKVGVSAESSVSKPAGADRTANRRKQAVYLKKLRRSNKTISEVQAGQHATSLKPIKKLQEQIIRPGDRLRDSATGSKSKRIERLEAESTSLSAPKLTHHAQRGQPPPAISTRERLRESQPLQSALKESSSNIRQLRHHRPEKPANEYPRNLRNELRDRHPKNKGTDSLVEEPRRPLRASTEMARNFIAESPKAVTTSPLKLPLKNGPEIISESRSLRHRDTPRSQMTTVARSSEQSVRKNSDLSKQQLIISSQKPSVSKKSKDIRRAIIQELHKRKEEKEQHSLKRKAQTEPIQEEKPNKRKINEKTYCICDDVSYGNMIACDNKNCKIEWYHLGCVNLKRPPKGEWICPLCTERRKNRRGRGPAR
ncbi:hypothetical protein V1506DRAFT_538425 [Lipomyces tetrasporus]